MSFAEQLRTIYNSTSTIVSTVNSQYSTNLIFAGVYDVVKRECINQARGMTTLLAPIPRARSFVLDTTATVNAVAAITVIPPPVLPQPGDPGYPYVPVPGTYVPTTDDVILIRDKLIAKLTASDMGLTVTPTGPANLTIAW